MDVIGNNIANVNTTAFKSSRVTFQDMLSQMLDAGSRPSSTVGGTNPKQVGLGVTIASIDSVQTQGSLQLTGKSTDLAIQGSGYFMVSDGSSIHYTRDGNFDLDALGYLVSRSSGYRVVGLVADDGGVIDPSQPVEADSRIQIPLGTHTRAKATENVTLAGNIDAQTTAGEVAGTSARIYDSLGTGHIVSAILTKTATANEWDWEARVTIGSNQYTVGSGTLTFDSDGRCEVPSGTISISAAQLANGAADLSASIDFSSVIQLAGDSTLMATDQDGFAIGTLESFNVGSDGLITGIFSNGLTLSLGQITLASFSNPGGLIGTGGNVFTESNNSGPAQVGVAGSSSRGTLSPGFIEAANVDLGTEFTNMITTQRGFQANSKIITVVDEMLQDLIQLKR
jgi:flagellar hook protein FlgE